MPNLITRIQSERIVMRRTQQFIPLSLYIVRLLKMCRFIVGQIYLIISNYKYLKISFYLQLKTDQVGKYNSYYYILITLFAN